MSGGCNTRTHLPTTTRDQTYLLTWAVNAYHCAHETLSASLHPFRDRDPCCRPVWQSVVAGVLIDAAIDECVPALCRRAGEDGELLQRGSRPQATAVAQHAGWRTDDAVSDRIRTGQAPVHCRGG